MGNNKFQFIDIDDIKDESIKNNIEEVSSPENVTVDSNKNINVNITKRWYFSFETRVFVSIVAILVLFACACFLGLKVLNHTTLKEVNYIENADFTYQVCLKTNDCVTESSTYKSAEIGKIKLLFSYNARYQESIDIEKNYRVAAVLTALDKNNHNVLYQKDIDLVETKELKKIDKEYTTNERIEIDYSKYINMMKDYSNADNQVEVILYMEENNETRKVSGLIIPLNKESFELNKYTTANVLRNSKITVSDWDNYSTLYTVVASILTIVSLILIYKTTRLVLKVTNNKNEYEEAVDNVLKEYESIITIAGDGFESIVPEEKETIKFDNFKELAKVSEEINKPIIYSKINNVKCEFLLEDDKNLYKYVMKEADFLEEDKNKLENK